MNALLLAGSANEPLAKAIAAYVGVELGQRELRRFPDGELRVEIQESVRGRDVYLIQPTSPPVEEHVMELLLLADACRRAGAAHVTAIVPYFGYARQDRRTTGREPVSAKLIADLFAAGGLQRVVALDAHTGALEGFFEIPLEHLSAVSLLAEAARPYAGPNSVVVAPDLGATKLAERYATRLQLPVAIVHKTRLSGVEVSVDRITGNVQGRAPLVVDDMISTGGTVAAAIEALVGAGCAPEITIVATHGLLVGPARQHLRVEAVQRLIVTDSVVVPRDVPAPLQVVSVAPLLADAIRRLHADESLGDLLTRT